MGCGSATHAVNERGYDVSTLHVLAMTLIGAVSIILWLMAFDHRLSGKTRLRCFFFAVVLMLLELFITAAELI